MRWEWQLSLYDLAARDERVFLIYGDVGAGLFAKFKADFPSRCLNLGVCEQSMVSIAAGMASEGLRPICYTITPFLIERAFEQIKLDVDQQRLPVGLVGYSDDDAGPTHQVLCAQTLMGLCRNIESVFPQTMLDVRAYLRALEFEHPWFMALKPDQITPR